MIYVYIYIYVIHNMSMQATTYYIVILVVPSYSVLNDFGKNTLGPWSFKKEKCRQSLRPGIYDTAGDVEICTPGWSVKIGRAKNRY